jgi:hypothetical protein
MTGALLRLSTRCVATKFEEHNKRVVTICADSIAKFPVDAPCTDATVNSKAVLTRDELMKCQWLRSTIH